MSEYEEPRAHQLREQYLAVFGGDELPVPVEQIAEDLEGLLVEERPGLAVSGMLYPAERRVVLNADEPPVRRRFTLAHELGHWVCQCRDNDAAQPVYCRAEQVGLDPAARALEREANIFAAELLMPEPAVRAAWVERQDVEQVAERLAVSPHALGWRLYNLELVGERPA